MIVHLINKDGGFAYTGHENTPKAIRLQSEGYTRARTAPPNMQSKYVDGEWIDDAYAIWLKDMSVTDGLSRQFEDIFDVLTAEQQKAIAPETLKLIADKKALRAKNPNK